MFEEVIMTKSKMLAPMVEQFPTWFGRFGFPESWQQFLDAESMRVEEFRDGDMTVVRAELPGIDPDKDVEVVVADGMLRIHAERTQRTTTAPEKGAKADKPDTERAHYRSEFRYGSFTRVLPLPAGASETDVTATYRDGILEVRVPTAGEVERTHKVAITRG
jgi:HSP20 family protein